MHEHPILGTVLFIIGTILIASAYAAGNAGDTVETLIAGHVLAFNGALLAALGTGRRAPTRLRNLRLANATLTRRNLPT